ncbi:hypothetical protein [Roseiterribacter gracilis]|uniref:Uncharacterized protein n=1 Tax=Roseiterribacter gracilis TaxID=2812848 RepID=A0A8S8XE60_9PROT|nr:hypothetical protein TMPK1_31410 [Rhodospirillales bacterium TMPK1]
MPELSQGAWIVVGAVLFGLIALPVLALSRRRKARNTRVMVRPTQGKNTVPKIRDFRDWLLEQTPPYILVSGAKASARYYVGYLDGVASIIARNDGADPDTMVIKTIAAMEAMKLLGDPGQRDSQLQEGLELLAQALLTSPGQKGRADGMADAEVAVKAAQLHDTAHFERFAAHFEFKFPTAAAATVASQATAP